MAFVRTLASFAPLGLALGCAPGPTETSGTGGTGDEGTTTSTTSTTNTESGSSTSATDTGTDPSATGDGDTGDGDGDDGTTSGDGDGDGSTGDGDGDGATGGQPDDGVYSHCLMAGACGDPLLCFGLPDGGGDIVDGFCSIQCAIDENCPVSPGGTAEPICIDIGGQGWCALGCGGGESCPTDMVCIDTGNNGPYYCF